MPRQRRKYGNPPIVEAVIDIRIRADQGIPIAALAAIGQTERERYPTRLEGVQIVEEVELKADQQARKTSRTPIGFVYKTLDEKQIFQAQVQGFVFSRLRPYDTWESFSGEARRLWGIYKAAANPNAVERIAVRYINRFDFSSPVPNLRDYLLVTPQTPELIQQSSGFLLRMGVPNPALESMLILNEALVPAAEGKVGIVLDLDHYRDALVSADDDALWQTLTTLHEHVEDVFEACLTDATRELIA